MGQQQSQPTFVLKNAKVESLDIPIQFSPNFLKRLHGLEISPPKPDNFEETVQERVNRELALQQEKRVIHEKRSADQVAKEAQDLLRRQAEIPVLKISPEVELAQEQKQSYSSIRLLERGRSLQTSGKEGTSGNRFIDKRNTL
ncbi:hypothetical protein HDV04_001279 [Boothiomyces sp. JEL0838]|nr:hypothetical protein HDV04_001279 [Boothiomyces sp. JEL0838]